MKSLLSFVKTTVIGGLVFLVPIVILILVLTQAFGLMLKVAEPLGELIPIDSLGGVALANIIVVLLILLICFVAGLFATRKYFSTFQQYIERKILLKIPGYGLVKGITDSVKMSEEASEHFIPVRVQIMEYEQIGFEIERTEDHLVVVYLPGAPNPWSGKVIYVSREKVTPIESGVPQALTLMEQLGMGSAQVLKPR